MVAASGFQEGAFDVARRHSVQLFTLKTLSATSEGKITDELMPVLAIYNFRFLVKGKVERIGIPEETGVLRMLLRESKIEGPEVNTTPEEVLEKFRYMREQSLSTSPQVLEVTFPDGTVLIHPNTGKQTPITSFSFEYRLVTVKDLKQLKALV